MNLTQLQLCIEAGSINDFYQINSELQKLTEMEESKRKEAEESKLTEMEESKRKEMEKARRFGSKAGRALLDTIRERFATLHSSEDSLITFYILTNDASFINTNVFKWDRVSPAFCCILLTSNKFREEAERQLHKFLLDFLKKPPRHPQISDVVRVLGEHGSLATNDLLVLLIDTWRSQRARLAQPSINPRNPEEADRVFEYIGFNLAIEATEKALEKLSSRSNSPLPVIGRPRRTWEEAIEKLGVEEEYMTYRRGTDDPSYKDFVTKFKQFAPSTSAQRKCKSIRRWALDLELDHSELSRDFVRSQFTGGEEMSDEDADRFIQYVRTVREDRERKKASKGDSAR